MVVNVGWVPSSQVAEVWPRIEKWVTEVTDLTDGRATPAETLHRLLTEQAMLWLANEDEEILGYLVMAFNTYPNAVFLTVEQLGGSGLDSWLGPMHEAMVAMAKHNGCCGLDLYGRDGWIRRLREFGWKKIFTVTQLIFEDDGEM